MNAHTNTTFLDIEEPERRLRQTYQRTFVVAWVVWVVMFVLLGYLVWWPLTPILLAMQLIGFTVGIVQYLSAGRQYLRREGLHPVTARTQPALYGLVIDVSTRMDVLMPPMFIVEDKSPNAFVIATGLNSRVVVFHTGWLDAADANATRGVLAHELAHIKNNDSLVGALMSGTGFLASTTSAAAGRSSAQTWKKTSPGEDLLAGIGQILGFLATLPFLMVKRSRESLADITAAKYLGAADPVIDGMRCILAAEEAFRKGHSTAQQPAMFCTHPATTQRIEFLRDVCARQCAKLS